MKAKRFSGKKEEADEFLSKRLKDKISLHRQKVNKFLAENKEEAVLAAIYDSNQKDNVAFGMFGDEEKLIILIEMILYHSLQEEIGVVLFERVIEILRAFDYLRRVETHKVEQ